MLGRLQDWWDDLWLVKVEIRRNTSEWAPDAAHKLVPRVRFYRMIDFYQRGAVGVYWSPRRTSWEGEELYQHYVRFTWLRLFGLDWQ